MTRYVSICFFIFLTLFSTCNCVLHSEENAALFFDDKYNHTYPKDFFETGGERVKFNPSLHLKIGIVIRNSSSMYIDEVIQEIFSVAPFDRYRDFFVFVEQKDVDRGIRNRDHFIRAYNSYGKQIPGGFDIGETSIQAGLIVLNVESYDFTKTGTKGYARGQTATAQKLTILHELGHALANLGDEYSVKENEYDIEKREAYKTIGISYDTMYHKVWNTEYPNIDYRSHSFLKWEPLIKQGFIAPVRIPRIQIQNGIDSGRFLIPSEACVMNRVLHDKMQFCPVCQLQIIDRVSHLSGIIPPWYQDE
jgi:hypothetical protein